MIVPVTIDSHLRVDGNMLGHDIVDQIFDELTIENPAYESAKAQGRWTGNIQKEFLMADMDGDQVILPRGYALEFKLLLRELGKRVDWIDNRTWIPGPEFGPDQFQYRIHQPQAVQKIKHHQQGIYKAPTGSGKTVTGLGFLWEKHPQKALVLVDRINLVDQWGDLAHKHFGDVDMGFIGEGEWSRGQVTVATIQSLWSRRHELIESGFFEEWSVVILDECHHVTAETYKELVSLFTAKYRFGMSATPDKTGAFLLALNVLGEVFHETPRKLLEELGLIITPHVEVIHTGFQHPYWPDHTAGEEEEYMCEVPGCKKDSKHEHSHKNNYAQVKKALVTDAERNQKIVQQLLKYDGRHQIVITDETTQIESIDLAIHAWNDADEMMVLSDQLFKLTGKDKRAKREEIIRSVRTSDKSILLSTIAGEGLDIPDIEVIHLVFPTKNTRSTEQKIGRGTRASEGKTEAVIIDYADVLVAPLAKHFRNRRWKVYEPMGLEVHINE